jgi:hypothetical protein
MAKTATVENSNSPSAEQIQSAVAAIEGRYAELLAERMASMGRCRHIRAAMREDFATAKADGIRPKILRKICKERELERTINALYDDFEDDEKSEAAMLVEKLGDFANSPLGQAAIQRATGGNGQAAVTGL